MVKMTFTTTLVVQPQTMVHGNVFFLDKNLINFSSFCALCKSYALLALIKSRKNGCSEEDFSFKNAPFFVV